MGRRSRKRAQRPVERGGDDRAGAGVRPPAPGRRPRRRGEAPTPPWGSFPLMELCVLLALGLGIAGFLVWGQRGQIMLAAGAVLGSLAGLEVSVREHFAGYRSHTTLLAGAAAVLTLGVLFFARAPRGVELGVGAVVFVAGFWLLRTVFKRRSGGFGFR